MTRYYRFNPELDGFVDSPKQYPADHASLTAIEPPEAQEGHARVFNRESQEWALIEDHRGETVYSTEHGTEREVKDLGPLPDDVTTEPRPDETHKWTVRGWEQDADLKAEADRQKAQAEAMEAARQRIATGAEVDPTDLAVALGFRDA